MTKVAITDDHMLIISGMKDLLSQLDGLELIESFTCIAETRVGLELRQPDVLLLDINLPDGDGIQYCKELKKLYPTLKVIALTTYSQNILVKNMMRNGADGFLLKNTSVNELQSAISTVQRGEMYLQPAIKEALLRDSIGAPIAKTTFRPTLTRREKEVLSLIMDELTTQEIADQLFISPKTVETHRLNLLQKLGVRNTAGLVKEAINQGLLE